MTKDMQQQEGHHSSETLEDICEKAALWYSQRFQEWKSLL